MARPQKYRVELSLQERENLHSLISTGRASAQITNRARILLKADKGEHGPAWPDHKIVEALDTSLGTVRRTRQKYLAQGLDLAITRKQLRYRVSRKKLHGENKARTLAVVTGAPPDGNVRWTLRLIAKRLVELEIVESISHETVRQFLKKIN